jgi:V/A-type H+-transporting ATPase subunit D
MSDKLKLTKESLSREKKALARFSRFLPTLKLRKTQLFNEIHRIRETVRTQDAELTALEADIAEWGAVFGEDIDVAAFCTPRKVLLRTDNVAGIEIPVLESVEFRESAYDLMTYPFWLDAGVTAVKDVIRLRIRLDILRRQLDIISAELTTTVQRINLFEKVKIPEAKENIRRIQIFLGDQQTAGVVRGKMTKSKLTRKRKARQNRPAVHTQGQSA